MLAWRENGLDQTLAAYTAATHNRPSGKDSKGPSNTVEAMLSTGRLMRLISNDV